MQRDWERPVFDRFGQVVGSGATIFDVGASFGLFAISAARAGAHVIAFEPDRETAGALKTHLEWNSVADRVEVVEVAVADRVGDAMLSRHQTAFMASLVEPSATQARVPTTTLDAFCCERGIEPDVVKIDVEGAEARVLAGSRGVIERRHAVFFIEVHERLISPAQALAELEGWDCEEIHSEPAGTRHYFCRPSTASRTASK